MFQDIRESLLHLFYPHCCAGCGTDILEKEQLLCLKCLIDLPQTHFHPHPNNPVEKIFWGRIPVLHASAHLYFTKQSLLQHLMHRFKYGGDSELGFYLGQQMGRALARTNRFLSVDGLLPLPLHPQKERARGYNQATVLCEGIASILQKPVWKNVIKRNTATETQTHKNRVERWQNMDGKFELVEPSLVEGRHILLVDDVITTGATLEACGAALLKRADLALSIASLCYAAH